MTPFPGSNGSSQESWLDLLLFSFPGRPITAVHLAGQIGTKHAPTGKRHLSIPCIALPPAAHFYLPATLLAFCPSSSLCLSSPPLRVLFSPSCERICIHAELGNMSALACYQLLWQQVVAWQCLPMISLVGANNHANPWQSKAGWQLEPFL